MEQDFRGVFLKQSDPGLAQGFQDLLSDLAHVSLQGLTNMVLFARTSLPGHLYFSQIRKSTQFFFKKKILDKIKGVNLKETPNAF